MPPAMNREASLQGLPFSTYFDKHRRKAVLLNRPYPPPFVPRGLSKFGGLPNLPAHYEWPRDGHGRPLHFLAQVDCADIPIVTPLPERGVLFFFAREDEEQIWNDPDWLRDAVRVIHALDAFAKTAERQAPDDLGPIGGHYPLRSMRHLVLEGEAGPSLHVEWPIEALPIDTFPDVLFEEEKEHWLTRLARGFRRSDNDWQQHEERMRAYDDALREKRLAAFQVAAGELPPDENTLNAERSPAIAIFAPLPGGTDFPFFWINIRHAARHLIWSVEQDRDGSRFDPAQVPAAREWLARADDVPDEAVPDEADRAEFRRWLMAWHVQRPEAPEDEHRYAHAVFHAARTNILAWAGDPHLAARLPERVYQAMRPAFAPRSLGNVVYSQMLGHAPSAQEPLHPDAPLLCLLNLCSDPVLGTMYGDVGNATFFITPGDLAKRDFSKVEAEVVGH